MSYRPIADYAIIGDCRSAALVSIEGSIDWLCLPRFDSPSLFAAILDARKGGRFQIRPVGEFTARRRYVPRTNVLETVFTCPTGVVALRDLMPVASEPEKRRELLPDHEVLREIEGLAGEVQIEVIYDPRPDYGRRPCRFDHRGQLGLWALDQQAALGLCSDIPLHLTDGQGARGAAPISAGQRAHLSFVYDEAMPAVIPPLGELAHQRVERSIRWWTQWADRCTYDGPYRDAVVRSALALKLLTYAPSGAVVAAPTTSLPEQIGGQRNWDYRYCWLRDAAFMLRALFECGYHDEADAFLGWVVHTTRLTQPQLNVVYDVFGEADLPERELAHLEGYRGSRPVRIGNRAHGQLQLDVYGEVMDAVAQFVGRGGRLDRDTSRLLDGLGQTVCRRWREPDEGIWEVRSGRAHHTHSKVLCWVALDRLIRLHEAGQITVHVDQYRAEREAIRAEVEAQGYSERLQAYRRTFEDDELDAALLQLPLYGYIRADHPRMRSTLRQVRRQLERNGAMYRYLDVNDGLPAGEGAFGICGFWAAECLALAGEVDEATALFERLLGYANDVGLLSEQVDPETGELLGNFPQGFSHLGVINAALTLARRNRAPEPTAAEPVHRLGPRA